MRLGLTLALGILIADQFSKLWVLQYFGADTTSDPTAIYSSVKVNEIFDFVLTWNRGVSFGLFNQDSPYNAWIFSTLALTIVGILLFWLKKSESLWTKVPIGLIIGGALGNVIDRLRLGAVVDFLSFHIDRYYWPAFNIADSAISIGAVIMIAEAWLVKPKKDEV